MIEINQGLLDPNRVVNKVGSIISSQVADNPERARWLLQTIYGSLKALKYVPGKPTVSNTLWHYNAAVSSVIEDAFKRPSNTVLINLFYPCELFTALDLTPLFPEAVSGYVANTACSSVFADYAEDHLVPDSLCSYHTVMIGMVESGIYPKPLAVANTSSPCDATRLSYRRVADFYGIPQNVIDIPNTRGDEAIAYVADQLRDAVRWLEELSGKKLQEERLKEAVAKSNDVLEAMRCYMNLRSEASLPTTTTSELAFILATHCMSSAPGTDRFMADMLELVMTSPRETRSVPRIFWVHVIPNWQPSIRAIFDKAAKAEIVGCDLIIDSLPEMDPDRPYESLAKRLVCNSNSGQGIDRIEDSLKGARACGADGIVLFCHWGCKQTTGLSGIAKEIFEDAGFPTLVLDGDACDPRNVSDGQMVTRINAFLEQLSGKDATS